MDLTKYTRILVVALLAINNTFCAQDNMGIAGSNYSPVNTVLVNPSSIVDSKAYIDLNLIGFGVFLNNNLAYLPKGGFQFFSAIADPMAIPAVAFKDGRKNYFAAADVNIHGPSFTFSAGNHAFGLYTGARSVVDARGLPESVSTYAVNGLQYNGWFGASQSIRNVRLNALAWGEIGINFATIVKKKNNELLTAGITIKRLIGVAGGAVRFKEWDYTVADSTYLETSNIDGRYGFNIPAVNNGRGWGIDLGITYKKMLGDVTSYFPHSPKSNCQTCDYKYKLAVAILDLGRIKFSPEFFYNEFNEEDGSVWESYTSLDASDAPSLDAALQEEVGLVNNEADKAKFRMMLPTALSAQFDYNFGHNVFVNVTGIFGVPWVNSFGPQRGAQLAVTPRFEVKRFEAALPVVLHEYRYPSVGLMLRLNSVIIGTDKLGTYLFNQDVYGADIYFNLKYTIFRNWRCKKSKVKKATKIKEASRLKGGALPCPSW